MYCSLLQPYEFLPFPGTQLKKRLTLTPRSKSSWPKKWIILAEMPSSWSKRGARTPSMPTSMWLRRHRQALHCSTRSPRSSTLTPRACSRCTGASSPPPLLRPVPSGPVSSQGPIRWFRSLPSVGLQRVLSELWLPDTCGGGTTRAPLPPALEVIMHNRLNIPLDLFRVTVCVIQLDTGNQLYC